MYRVFYKEAVDCCFWRAFKKSHKNLKKIIFQSHVSNLDQKAYSKFSYCYTGIGVGCSTKEPITATFVEHFNKNQENTICAYVVYVIRILHGKTNTTW